MLGSTPVYLACRLAPRGRLPLTHHSHVAACASLSRLATSVGQRDFSSSENSKHDEAITKLKAVFEEYRRKNYTREFPSRFRKEVVSAADKNNDGVISAEEISELLANIGASEKMTKEEIGYVMEEAGVKGDIVAIPVKQMMKLL